MFRRSLGSSILSTLYPPPGSDLPTPGESAHEYDFLQSISSPRSLLRLSVVWCFEQFGGREAGQRRKVTTGTEGQRLCCYCCALAVPSRCENRLEAYRPRCSMLLLLKRDHHRIIRYGRRCYSGNTILRNNYAAGAISLARCLLVVAPILPGAVVKIDTNHEIVVGLPYLCLRDELLSAVVVLLASSLWSETFLMLLFHARDCMFDLLCFPLFGSSLI